MPSIKIHRRVYYDDTDCGGVVYHTNYLKYMEHARSEFLNERGYAPWLIEKEHQVLFVATELDVKYLAPAKLGDQLEIKAAIKKVSGVTVQFEQSIWLLGSDDKKRTKKLAIANIKVVCLDADSFKPTRIPHEIQESILSEC